MAKRRWRVRARKTIEVEVEVEADDQEQAEGQAVERVRQGQHNAPAVQTPPVIEVIGIEPSPNESDMEDIDYSEQS